MKTHAKLMSKNSILFKVVRRLYKQRRILVLVMQNNDGSRREKWGLKIEDINSRTEE